MFGWNSLLSVSTYLHLISAIFSELRLTLYLRWWTISGKVTFSKISCFEVLSVAEIKNFLPFLQLQILPNSPSFSVCRPKRISQQNLPFKGLHIYILMLHEDVRDSSNHIHLSKSSPQKITKCLLISFFFFFYRPVTCHGRGHQNNDLPAGSCGYFTCLHRGVFRPGNESYWFSLSKRAAADEQLGAAGGAGDSGWYLDQLSRYSEIRHQNR